jgi:6-pyruvoyl-tetrahydropterin synthase
VQGERPRPLHGGARFSESQQRLHGGTFVVDALFSGTTLDNGPNYLIDICLAEELVRRATAPLKQTHLDGDSTVLLKAAGVANATASGLAKALWTSIAQGLPTTHGLRGLKLVVAEHDASVAEYNGRLGHAPTLPTPTMRRALERPLMEKELPWCESGWPLIAEDDPLIVPMMTGYGTGANLELDPLAPVLPFGTTIRTSVTRSFSLFNDNGAERMWRWLEAEQPAELEELQGLGVVLDPPTGTLPAEAGSSVTITMTPRALGKLQRYLHFAVSLHGCSARSHISRVCT